MAAIQQPQFQPRARTARVGAPARPLHQHVLQNGGITATSPLHIFLTNLKLLDLDLSPEWPGISTDTFHATGNNAQGQKKRIQCVEWSLFHLFALWDPEETALKLKPFFPPLDQVQSLNLRAALLRALEQAKKNGILGRDAVLRKTMLDECKGERLEEVLAAFSSAVLRKVVVSDTAASGQYPAVALSLASEIKGYKDDKTDLSTLVLAHRVSLHRLWDRRQAADNRFVDFADLLGVKERGVARRQEEACLKDENGGSKTVSDDAKLETRRAVSNNWTGNEQWMETLLSGDASVRQNGPFGDMPFDRVWRRVEQNRLSELEVGSTGLLEQLEGRVKMHNERLEKWKSYRRRLYGERSDEGSSPSKKAAPAGQTRGINLKFGAHESLRTGRMSPRKTAQGLSLRVNDEYRSLMDGLKDELTDVGKEQPNSLTFLHKRRPASPPLKFIEEAEESEKEVSEISDLEDHENAFAAAAPIQSFQAKLEATKRLPFRPVLPRPDQTSSSGPTSASEGETGRQSYDSPSPSPPRRRATPRLSPDRRILESEVQLSASPTQDAADQILALMNNASPSPLKPGKPRHTLSLEERTRLSMAPRGSSLFLADDEPEPSPDDFTTTIPLNDESTETLKGDGPDDLISRTRRSMAGFEKARQKAQVERRRSQRRSKLPPQRKDSYFPKLEEEHGDNAFTEELIEEDMEAVFRSRPKVVASPMPSPTRMDFDDGYL